MTYQDGKSMLLGMSEAFAKGFVESVSDKMDEAKNNPIHISKVIVAKESGKTIVFFNDGTKSIAKCSDGDYFSAEAGIMAACCKRLFGKASFSTEIAPWVNGHDGTDVFTVENLRDKARCSCVIDSIEVEDAVTACVNGEWSIWHNDDSIFSRDKYIPDFYNHEFFLCSKTYGAIPGYVKITYIKGVK